MNKIILKEEKIRYFLFFILGVILFGIGYCNSGRGIDFSDEGAYVSMPMRYTMGDIPFRDEIVGTPRPAHLLVTYLFKMIPDISLRQIRLCGVLIAAIGFSIFFLFISRYIYPFLAAILCIIMFLINNYYGLLSPSYNLLSNNFLSISLALWIFSLGTASRLKMLSLAVSGGLFLGLAVTCYPTVIFITSVPLLFILFILIKLKEYKSFIFPTAIFLLSFFIILGIAFFCLVHYNLLADFIEVNRDLLVVSTIYSKGPIAKLFDSMLSAWHYRAGPLIAGLLFLTFFFFVTMRKKTPKIIFPVLVILAFTTVLVSLYLSVHSDMNAVRLELIYFMTLLTLIILFITSLAKKKCDPRSAGKPSWAIVKNILVCWGIVLSLIYAVSSTSASNCIMGVMPLFLVGMFSLYRMANEDIRDAFSNSPIRNIGPVLFYLIVTALTYAAFMYNIRYIFNNAANFRELNYPFRHPKLAGIYSTKEKVKAIEALLDYLDKRVKPNDYFLAYNQIPLLYYLTHTRPAYSTVWIVDTLPLALRKKLLVKMVKENRIPGYCVRILTESQGDWKVEVKYDEDSPLDSYVKSHYYLEKTIYPFEIWHQKQEQK